MDKLDETRKLLNDLHKRAMEILTKSTKGEETNENSEEFDRQIQNVL